MIGAVRKPQGLAERPTRRADGDDCSAEQRDRQAHERSRDGDPEVHPGGGGLLLHLCDAAEHPEVDSGDADPVSHGHDRVAQLVQDDRCEQQQDADRRQHERLALLPRKDVLVAVSQPPDEEEDD